ncbi:MAG TPA: ABATE domain-containing protein [Myxococcales bacterium]|nr:ABATE domain-containing protein [Myxococcales bacterium]
MPGAREEKHRFELDGGTVSLDFVNTVSGMRGSPNMRDRLLGYPDLVYWAAQIGLIDARRAKALYAAAGEDQERAAAAHALAIRRREALHDVALAAVDGRPPPAAALETLNAWIADALARRRFRPAGPGRFQVELADDGDLLAFLRPVALDAAELLEHEVSSGLVGVCAERDIGRCAWLFLDSTRNHSRRFCNMKECGNRAKQRRHYQRTKGARKS